MVTALAANLALVESPNEKGVTMKLGFSSEQRRPWRRFLFGLLVGVAGLLPLGSAEAEPQDGQKFQDWMVRCQSAATGAAAPPCFIFQNVVESDKDRQIMMFVVAYPPGQGRPRAVVILPLGIDLRGGIEIAIDDGAPQRHAFISCFQDGCQVHIDLDDAVLAGFKRGIKGFITFRSLPDGRAVRLPISFKGFTAALKSLR